MNTNTMTSQDTKLSTMERIGYGLGDYANNLVCSAINAFLLKSMQMEAKRHYNSFRNLCRAVFVFFLK